MVFLRYRNIELLMWSATCPSLPQTSTVVSVWWKSTLCIYMRVFLICSYLLPLRWNRSRLQSNLWFFCVAISYQQWEVRTTMANVVIPILNLQEPPPRMSDKSTGIYMEHAKLLIKCTVQQAFWSRGDYHISYLTVIRLTFLNIRRTSALVLWLVSTYIVICKHSIIPRSVS